MLLRCSKRRRAYRLHHLRVGRDQGEKLLSVIAALTGPPCTHSSYPPKPSGQGSTTRATCNERPTELYEFQILGRHDEEWVHPVPLFFVTCRPHPAAERMEQNEQHQTWDDRIIRDTGMDARVAAIVGPVLRALDFRLVRVRLSGQNGLTLQIMAERSDGSMTVEDCEEVSRAVSPALDVEDPIDKAYHLEISSPGIDRPLVRKSDFDDAVGHLAKVETGVPVEGRKRFRGKITAVGEASFTLESDKAAYGESPVVEVPFDALSDARLILTDDLIRDALKKDKKLRQERKRRARADDDVTDDDGLDDADAPETGEAASE